MAGAKKVFNSKGIKKRIKLTLDPSPKGIVDRAKQAIDDTGEIMTPDNSAMEKLIAEQNAQNKAQPMPDDYELARARRRRGGARGGRSSTIMSQGFEGLGG